MAWYAVLGTVCTGAAVGPLVLGMSGIVAAGAAALQRLTLLMDNTEERSFSNGR